MADNAALPSFSEAFQSAVEEHSGSPEAAGSPTENQTAESESTPQEPAPAPGAAEASAEEPLLTESEVQKLPPEAQIRYKELNRAWTQKTQRLAERTRELEDKFAGYQEFAEALQRDPRGALQELATHLGLSAASLIQPPASATTEPSAAERRLASALPPELNFLAKALAPVLEAELDPIKRAHDDLIQHTALVQTEAVLERFTERYPDWQKHEAGMLEEGKSFDPAPGIDEFSYLEKLYRLATYGKQSAEQTRKTVDRINRAAGTTEPPDSGVTDTRISQTGPARPTLAEAFAAAKQGTRWEG